MKISLLLASCSLLFACADGPAAENRAGGGKADRPTDIAEVDLECAVVLVEDSDVMEEGLGSAFLTTDEGEPFVDGDSITVEYRESSVSRHESGRLFSIGQTTIGFSERDTLVELDDEPEFNDATEFLSVEGRNDDSNDIFRLRVFTNSMLGIVYVRAHDADLCLEFETETCGFSSDPDEVADCEDDATRKCESERVLARVDCREGAVPAVHFEF